jgi:hypothetical protein
VGEAALKRVKDVTGEQGKNSHHQNRFQLFVVRAGAAEVIAGRLAGIVLDRQALADVVRSDVLGPLVAELAVMRVSAVTTLVSELDYVVACSSAEVIVKSNPLTGVDGSVRGRP